MEKKFRLFVIVFLILQPFLDIYAGSGLAGNIHILIRGIFLISVIFYTLMHKNSQKSALLLTTILFIYFISYLFLYDYSLLQSINFSFKLFYLPFTTLFFYYYMENIPPKVIFSILFSYIGLFLFCYFFNLSHAVYEVGVDKEGFIGLFHSINEFSAILIILLPLVLYFLSQNKNYISCILITLLISIVGMLTGTKVMLLGCIITFLYFLYTPFSYYFRGKRKLPILIVIIFIMILSSLAITKTRAYKNALVQAEFFEVEHIFSLKGINKVLFNDRFSFIEKNHGFYKHSSFHEKVFGLKYDQNRKDVEIDFFDLFYKYGVLGFILIVIFILYYGYKSRIRNVYLLSFLFFLLISETSGHVLIYPAVSIYLGLIFYYNHLSKNRGEI
ncbi:MAG: hypothetical protein HFJ38_06260 [Bacilli bacterium]|nr:hypothetical protein [Bacilli bacterium]